VLLAVATAPSRRAVSFREGPSAWRVLPLLSSVIQFLQRKPHKINTILVLLCRVLTVGNQLELPLCFACRPTFHIHSCPSVENDSSTLSPRALSPTMDVEWPRSSANSTPFLSKTGAKELGSEHEWKQRHATHSAFVRRVEAV